MVFQISFSWLSIIPILLCAISLNPVTGNGFCYGDDDSDCPDPAHWGGYCNTGESQHQSPIHLPKTYTPSIISRSVTLHTSNYHSNGFSMRNNGHTLAVKLSRNSTAPISLVRKEGRFYSKYRLDSAHFHWGRNDLNGSEHCLEDRCFSAEMHLVHYKSDFDSFENATQSQDSDAIAVVGIMFEVSEKAGDGNKQLDPILSSMTQIVEPSDEWIDVDAGLDFRAFLSTAVKGNHYNYKGSLTTPDCNENVNWFVFDKAVAVSSKDLETLRSLNDGRGRKLTENIRPLQERNGRGVYFATVKQV